MQVLLRLKNYVVKVPKKRWGIFILTSALAVLWPRSANAFMHQDIKEYIMTAILTTMAFIVGAVSFILNIVTWVVAWAAKEVTEFFIQLALTINYTSGGLFDAGWPIVRDLANMGLILVLIAIGIGTILNLKSANKSLLPIFLGVALLINFTPVITGIVIDLSNIVSRIFFDSAVNTSNALLATSPSEAINEATEHFPDFNEIWNTAEEAIDEGNDTNTFDVVAIFLVQMMEAVFAVLINLILIFIFILLSFLFLLRILMLILLVIFSPLGFLALILPATKKYWRKWWHNFLQWSIIAIPLLFSMWVAGLFLNNPVCEDETLHSGGGVINDSITAITTRACDMMTMLLAIITLIAGVIVSLNSSAAGAKVVTQRGQKTWNWGKKKAGQAAKAGTTGLAGAGVKKGARELEERTGARGRVSELGTKLKGSKAAQLPIVGGAFRAAGKGAEKAGREATQKEVKNKEKAIEGKNEDQLTAGLRSAKGYAEFTAHARKLAKENPDRLEEELNKNETLKKRAGRYMKYSDIANDEMFDDIYKKSPELIKENPKFQPEKDDTEEEIVQKRRDMLERLDKIIDKLKPEDVSNMTSDSLIDPDVIERLFDKDKINQNTQKNLAQSENGVEKLSSFYEGINALAEREVREELQLSDELQTPEDERLEGGLPQDVQDNFKQEVAKRKREWERKMDLGYTPGEGLEEIMSREEAVQEGLKERQKAREGQRARGGGGGQGPNVREAVDNVLSQAGEILSEDEINRITGRVTNERQGGESFEDAARRILQNEGII